jgi:peptidoglycan/xylan/chitin deacetylase (PgdA/CDA1 family)
MLSFDVDGLTLWINTPDEAKPGLVRRAVSLGNYGPNTAMPRILDMLDRLAIPATFFMPSFTVENWPDMARSVRDAGHEIGMHGHLHETFYGRSYEKQRALIDHSQGIFDRVLGLQATGFRAPSGDWTIKTPHMLVDAGFDYSSSYRGDDRPFRWHVGAGKPLVEIPGHWELDDFPQFAYNDRPASPRGQDRPAPSATTFENWEWEFNAIADEGLAWVLMTHPQVIGTPNRLNHLERLMLRMQERGDVWFARGADIAGWVADVLEKEPGTMEVER